MDSLHTKYRPQNLNEIIGQGAVVSALENNDLKRTHTYLLHGPSGTGKTTIARIIANKLNCDPSELEEVDAASHTTVDYWRDKIRNISLQSIIGSVRCMVVDECQTLSSKSWDALLKVTEEPPDHFFWFFCTTEYSKVPEQIVTRCLDLKLERVPDNEIEALLTRVVNSEQNIDVNPHTVELIAEASGGSPRKALTTLAKVANVSDESHIETLLSVSKPPPEVIDLIRFLMRPNWPQAKGLIKKIKEEPESVRRRVLLYYSKVAVNQKSFSNASKAINIIHSFKEPYPTRELGGEAHLLLSIGTLIQE